MYIFFSEKNKNNTISKFQILRCSSKIKNKCLFSYIQQVGIILRILFSLLPILIECTIF